LYSVENPDTTSPTSTSKNTGGFIGFTNRPNFASFMKRTFTLDWSFGAYQRTDFALNPSATMRGEGLAPYTKLLPEYSMKVTFQLKVEEREEAIELTQLFLI